MGTAIANFGFRVISKEPVVLAFLMMPAVNDNVAGCPISLDEVVVVVAPMKKNIVVMRKSEIAFVVGENAVVRPPAKIQMVTTRFQNIVEGKALCCG